MSLTLVIADDHKIVRDGLRGLFERESDFSVIGEAEDGRGAVRLVCDLQPDILLLDLAMPEMNGVEATRQMRAAGFSGGIVVLSMHRDRRSVVEARAAGVNGYVLKDYAFQQVLSAISAVVAGDYYLSPQIAHFEIGGRMPTLAELLSSREREVFQLFAEGQSTKEIASKLHVSPKTIESHRLHLFAKLQVNNIADLTRAAVREGVTTA